MFKMIFEFKRREEDSFLTINKVLESMPLSNVGIEDSDGYLRKQTTYKDGQPDSTTLNYCFDRIVLSCKQDKDEDMLIWQMDEAAFPKGEFPDSSAYHDRWCAAHPDRVMRVLQQISFDNADAFVVLHHAKIL